MSTTKAKILTAAITCFNQEGIANVRLQHIADAANLSIGNMAYHFRTKEIIVQQIWESLVAQQRQLMAEFRVVPLFEDLERQIRRTHQLQASHEFFYVDTLEVMRAYPQIAAAHRQHLQWQIQQFESMLAFNAARGALLPEPATGQYPALARHYTLTTETWRYQQKILGQADFSLESFRATCWELLCPHFSTMGQLEFGQLNALILENYF